MVDTWLRARAVLVRRFRVVAAALVVVAAAGGWFAYGAVASPRTETETRVVSAWSTTGTFDHEATVVADNPLYPVGTTLSDRPAYFRSVSPTVAVTFRYGYDVSAGTGFGGGTDGADEVDSTDEADGTDDVDGTTGTDVIVAVRARLVVSEVEGRPDPESADGTAQTVFWRTTRDLGRWRVAGLAPGETVAFPVAVNVSRVARRVETIRDGLGGGLGQVRTRVLFDVRLTGPVAGRRVANETRYALPLSVGRTAVRVDDPGRTTARRERTRVVTVRRPPDAARVGAGALMAAGSLAALAGLVAARRRGLVALSDAERAAVEHARARREFEEWITAGRLPAAVRSRPRVEVASLPGLVDVAIDTDARVVEDDGEYVVPTDGLLYVYAPPDGAVAGADAVATNDDGDATPGDDGGPSGDDGPSSDDDGRPSSDDDGRPPGDGSRRTRGDADDGRPSGAQTEAPTPDDV